MAGCMATLRPLMKRAQIKLQTLRSSRFLSAEQSLSVEVGMTSSNEQRESSKSADVFQVKKDAGSTSEDQNHGGSRARNSHSTGRGSMECILSPSDEKQHAFGQGKSLELDRTNTWPSVCPNSANELPPLVPMLNRPQDEV